MRPSSIDVWVMGLGAMTPLGADIAITWSAMQVRKNGIASLSNESWSEPLPVRIAALLSCNPADCFNRFEARKLDRCEQIALVATREAWADASSPQVEPERLAVVIGTGMGGLTLLLGQNQLLENFGARHVSPYAVTMLMANGTEIPAVAIAFLTFAAANCDEERCEKPNEFDLAQSRREHMAFGGGIHNCIGKHLARLEAEVAFEALIRRNPKLAILAPGGRLGWRVSPTFSGLRSLVVSPGPLAAGAESA